MNALKASSRIYDISTILQEAKQVLDVNDTMDFDLERKLNLVEELATEILEYVSDQT